MSTHAGKLALESHEPRPAAHPAAFDRGHCVALDRIVLQERIRHADGCRRARKLAGEFAEGLTAGAVDRSEFVESTHVRVSEASDSEMTANVRVLRRAA